MAKVPRVTPDAEIIPSKQLHLYTIRIPDEIRNAALEAKIRIDVTLAYTALPRRTRARRTGYLETWLDWETSKLGEPRDEFLTRMQKGVLQGFSGAFYLAANEHVRDQSGKSPQELAVFSVRPQGGASWGSKLAPLLV